MRFTDFLTSVPPGTESQVEDLFTKNYARSSSTADLKIFGPDIKMYCNSEKCEGMRYFQAVSTPELPFNYARTQLDIPLTYSCRNCGGSAKTFALRVVRMEDSDSEGVATKFGELPPYGPPVPARVISLIGPDRDLFLRGRRAENLGLGIGAFAYYRRVVENQKGRLIKKIGEVAVRLGASPEVRKTFTRAANESQFSKAVEDVKSAIPQALLIQGHNPLTLLHSALSEGLHANSEDQCLKMATSIRVILTELSERISTALKDEAELQQALKTLLNRKSS